jgi:phage minor structural protein, putative
VYRPANVLAAACSKFKLLPLTHHHPSALVDSRNFRDLTIGYTGENPFVDYLDDKDEVGIRSNVLLYDDEAQGAYERGEKQLSPGYIAVFEWQQGKSPHGESYDIVMKEICDVNHLALLPSGRGGEDAVVLDKEPERQTIFDVVRMTKDEQDANGNEHSPSNGQFVSKGEGGEKGDGQSEKKRNDEYRKEIKEKLKNSMGKDLPNDATGITASISSEGLNKMMSGKAIQKSFDNGFSSAEHFEAVGRIVELFKKARLVASYPDKKHGDPAVNIKRFISQDKLKSDKPIDALITVKESYENGHRIYSLELDEINKASLRWQPTKDGKAVYQATATGSPTNTITQSVEKRKTIFERVQGTIFDLYAP